MMRIPDDLPGAELVRQGLEDVARGSESVAALLVAVGAPRLRRLGIPAPETAPSEVSPELRLYRRVGRESPRDAHSRYNALVRRLVSFEHALELRRRRDTELERRSKSSAIEP